MITREGPHFQAICLKMRTLASDHVTKNESFVEILAESRFQTRPVPVVIYSFSDRKYGTISYKECEKTFVSEIFSVKLKFT